MISEEIGEKILALFREIGILKLAVFCIVIPLGYQSLIILQDLTAETAYTPEGHTITLLVLINLIVMCIMYVAYMYDHIFAAFRKVFV